MENSYGIGVRNRYELFYDDNVDPLDLLKKSEKKKKDKTAEKENKAKPVKTKEPATGKKAVNPTAAVKESSDAQQTDDNQTQHSETQQQPPQQSIASKSPQTYKPTKNNETRVKFSDREERNNRRNKPDNEKERENIPPTAQKFDSESGRGRGRGFGGAVFGRGGRGGRRGGGGGGRGDFRGKREFDRQSGMVTSGVKAFDKRDGGGSFNWGSDKDQIDDQLQNDDTTATTELNTSGEASEKVSSPEDGNANVVNGTTQSADEETSKEDEAPKEMTLDEWKASQKRAKPQFNIRKAGEGEDTGMWKKTYVLKGKEAGSVINNVPTSAKEDSGEEEYEEGVNTHGRRKVLIPIDIQFADTPLRGRGRGRGRGGPGRGRGMGGSRGMRGGGRYAGAGRQEAPRMDDERDFPSLG